MGRWHARQASSPAGRELHTHLATAMRAVRRALVVCVRESRGRRRGAEAPSYSLEQRKLQQAMGLMERIGHLEGTQAGSDLTQEARVLCSWLESRERVAGIRRPSRRGAEYQARLRQVVTFLGEAGALVEVEDEDELPVQAAARSVKPEPTQQFFEDPAVPGGD